MTRPVIAERRWPFTGSLAESTLAWMRAQPPGEEWRVLQLAIAMGVDERHMSNVVRNFRERRLCTWRVPDGRTRPTYYQLRADSRGGL